MIGKYTSNELKPDYAQVKEDLRLHNILIDLFQRRSQKIELSEAEKTFICMFLKNADGDVPPFNVAEVCASFNFKFLYLIYAKDLTGGSPYFKPYGLDEKQIPILEAAAELEFLKDEATSWQKKLDDKANSDPLMLAAIREYEFELKHVQEESQEYQSKFQFGGQRKYEHDVFATQLQNKFIYFTAKEVFDEFESSDLTLVLNGKNIIINENSLVHIINRHFAESVKRYKSKKSFHNENFHPKLLNKQLRSIVQQIENAGGLNASTVSEFYFSYLGDIYKIYTTDKPNNTGDIYLATFFIVTDPKQLQHLTENYNIIKIDNDLHYYQPL